MRLNNSYEDYMFNFIKRVCRKFGPRLAGTDSEKKVAEIIKKDFKKYCDEVTIDKHKIRFTPPFSYIKIAGIIFLIGLAFFFWIIEVSLFLSTLSLFIIISSMFFGKKFLWFFFPKGDSQNVIAKSKPKNKRKKIIIFGAHHDSGLEYPLYHKFHKKFAIFIISYAISILSLFLLSASRVFFTSYNPNFIHYTNTLIVIPIIGSFFVLTIILKIVSNRPTLGANDNLSSVAVCLGIAKYISKNRPKNVEVQFVSFGSEEIGTYGSKNFVKKYSHELKNSYTIIFEILGEKNLCILTREGFTKYSSEIANLLYKAAKECKIPIKFLRSPLPGTDCLSFARKGFKTIMITGLGDDGLAHIWHSLDDVPENLEMKNLRRVAEISIEFIKMVDDKL